MGRTVRFEVDGIKFECVRYEGDHWRITITKDVRTPIEVGGRGKTAREAAMDAVKKLRATGVLDGLGAPSRAKGKGGVKASDIHLPRMARDEWYVLYVMSVRLRAHRLRSGIVMVEHPEHELARLHKLGLLSYDEDDDSYKINAMGRKVLRAYTARHGTTFHGV